MSTMKRVKIVFEGKIRKFEVPEDRCHVHVKKLIERTTQNRGFIPILQYMDEDSDWITIGTDADLALCLQTATVPKIYIFHPTDPVWARKEKVRKEVEDESAEWVSYSLEEEPEIIPAPAPRAQAPEGQPNVVNNDAMFAQMQRAASVLLGAGGAPKPAPAPMAVDEEEEKKDDPPQPAPASPIPNFLPVDWNTLVEDLLTHQRAISSLISDVYAAVEKGGDVKTAVIAGLKKEPFSSHPFVKNGLPDMEKMLDKVNHMSALILRAGKSSLEMAVPLLLRGFAKNKMGGSNVVDLAPVFMTAFPMMTQWLKAGVPNGQEATFDVGKVLRQMVAGGPGAQPRGGEVEQAGEPAQDAEVAAAAKDGIVIHKGITCDICEEKPIIGVRYKCMICPDFDMCEACKEKGTHPSEHPLIAMNRPAPRCGFEMGTGHYKGACEMIRGPWGKGGKCRRAFKKMCKRMNKDNVPAPASKADGDEEKEGCPRGEAPDEQSWANSHPHHGHFGRRRGFGGRGRWRHRHHPFGHPHHGGHPFGGMTPAQVHAAQAEVQTVQPFGTTPGYGSDSTSSSSSSSDSDDFDMDRHHTRGRGSKGRHGRHNKRRSKKHLKKLMKKQKKIAHKVNKLMHRQNKIHRKLTKLKNKESMILEEIDRRNRAMRAEAESQRQQGLGAPPNNPGHDPNPNQRPKRPQNQFPMFPFGPFHRGPMHPPHPMHPMPYQPPSAPPAPGPAPAPAPQQAPSNEESYPNQIALLMEMGFDDVATLKRLLKETKGDIKSVVMMLTLQSAKNNGFGKLE